MCLFNSSQPSPEPAAIQQPAQVQDQNVTKARTDAEQRRRAMAGANSTILASNTGGSGSTVPTTAKTLLGQ